LEKIEMKKTLVAVAALAAVSGAMAEVTISGFIDQAWNTTRTTTAAGASTTVKSLGNNAIGQDALRFSASEDLGDGMKITAGVNTIFNSTGNAAAAATTTPANSVSMDAGSGLTLSGGFGSVYLGLGYSAMWNTMAAAEPTQYGVGVGNVHAVGNGGGYANAVAYTLPAFVSGLSVTIGHGPGEVATGYGDGTDIAVSYNNGPLTLATAYGTSVASGAATGFTVTPVVGSVAVTQEAITAGSRSTAQAFTVAYDFGMAKVFAGYAMLKTGGDADQKANSSNYGISAPLGNITVALSFSDAKYTEDGGTTASATGVRLLAKYNLSKRTYAYVQYGTQSNKLSTGASGGSATGNGIGLTHSF
jgi:predicted porin